MKILELLNSSSIVNEYEIFDYRKWETGTYYKIHIEIINHTNLYIREYVDDQERKYSFHWQKQNNDLIVRWDNAPYHEDVVTYPHHKHKNEKILESEEITLQEVLEYIEDTITSQE